MRVLTTETVECVVQRSVGRLTTAPLSASLRKWHIDHSGNCMSPVILELHGRPETRMRKRLVLPKEGKHMTVVMEVRCRQCENCLKARSAHWRMRILSEADASARTWLGTLTVEPNERVKSISRCRLAMHKQGLDFDALAPDDQFAQIHADLSKEVTRYLKRVRKQSGAPLRYIAVAEAHKSGFPHFHMLVHESDPDQPVRWKHLSIWKLGFSKWNLVPVEDRRGLTYCAKYLSKSLNARVRASLHYGQVYKNDVNERDYALNEHSEPDAKRDDTLTHPQTPLTYDEGGLTDKGKERSDEFKTLSRIKKAVVAAGRSI